MCRLQLFSEYGHTVTKITEGALWSSFNPLSAAYGSLTSVSISRFLAPSHTSLGFPVIVITAVVLALACGSTSATWNRFRMKR